MKVKVPVGPWVAVVAVAGEHGEFKHVIVGHRFANRDEAEAFLRKNHAEACRAQLAWPMNIEEGIGYVSLDDYDEMARTAPPNTKH